MEVKTHPKFNYRISAVTGKRLPSKKTILERIAKLETELTKWNTMLSEHLLVGGVE